MTIEQAQTYREKIIELLTAEKLPLTDLPETLDNFIVAISYGSVVGAGGVEVYGNYGLLRSLAVHPQYRNKGIGSNLLTRLENTSKMKGLTALYLLTEGASGYFERHSYYQVSRQDVPAELQQSSQFTHVCPVSAGIYKKIL